MTEQQQSIERIESLLNRYKARAYDLIASTEVLQNELREVNNEIGNLTMQLREVQAQKASEEKPVEQQPKPQGEKKSK